MENGGCGTCEKEVVTQPLSQATRVVGPTWYDGKECQKKAIHSYDIEVSKLPGLSLKQ